MPIEDPGALRILAAFPGLTDRKKRTGKADFLAKDSGSERNRQAAPGRLGGGTYKRTGNYGVMIKPFKAPFGNPETAAIVERRRQTRIYDPIFVEVRGADAGGRKYRFSTIARNIGSGGLCAYAPQVMEAGQKLTLHIRFARAGSEPKEAPAIAARAVVLRVEKQFNGSYLFAASFRLHRFV